MWMISLSPDAEPTHGGCYVHGGDSFEYSGVTYALVNDDAQHACAVVCRDMHDQDYALIRFEQVVIIKQYYYIIINP